MPNRLLLLALALATSLAPAATASAQADFSGTLDATTPKFTWESSGSGIPYLSPTASAQQCAGFPVGTDCESVLLNVGVAADLQITLDSVEGITGPEVPGAGPIVSLQDIDGFLYKSNAAAEQQGEALSNGDADAGEPDCVTSFPSEQCKVKVTPGYYVLVVEYYFADAAPVKGTAELLGVTATPPPPGGGDPQQPPQQPQQPQQPPQQQPQQPAPGPGQQAPGTPLPREGKLTVDAAADSGKRSTAVKRGVRGRIRCSVQCKVKAVASVDKKVARKLKLGRKAVKIAKGKASITKAGRIPFYIKLSKKAKKALKRKGVKKFALKVAFTVTDSQGKQLKKITRKTTLR